MYNSFLIVRDGVSWVLILYNYLVIPNYMFPMAYFINVCVGEFILEAAGLQKRCFVLFCLVLGFNANNR